MQGTYLQGHCEKCMSRAQLEWRPLHTDGIPIITVTVTMTPPETLRAGAPALGWWWGG